MLATLDLPILDDAAIEATGFEGTFEAIRPYLEWSIDVPANRQDYRCAPGDVFASDVCLEKHITFGSAPSRLTLGARALLFLDGITDPHNLGFHPGRRTYIANPA